jgi:hypothetical protein
MGYVDRGLRGLTGWWRMADGIGVGGSRRKGLRSGLAARVWRGTAAATSLLVAGFLAAFVVSGSLLATMAAPAQAHVAPSAAPAPVFAYYYMWMQGTYWSRNKLDHPVRPFPGDYRSDDPAVIDWQVTEAQKAGITGFIVAWKDNPTYRRIVPLVEAAADRHHFSLILQYEAVDAAKVPAPISRIAADFAFFIATYAGDPAWFRIGGKPVTVWNDTRYFSAADVSAVTRPLRSRIKVLNSAFSIEEYRRISRYTDGDAYYWSAINPTRNPSWRTKLLALAAAIREVPGKIWIAPFAPGFDATLLGGTVLSPRDNGKTLTLEYAAAAATAPDIMGLISWNEWTENTHIEPSITFGEFYVELLASLVAATPPPAA